MRNQSLWWNRSSALQSGTTQWLPYWANGNVPLLMLLKAAGPSALSRVDPATQFESVIESIVAFVLTRIKPMAGLVPSPMSPAT